MPNEQNKSTEFRTFSERHGYQQTPESFQLEYLSENVRKDIWYTIGNLLASEEESIQRAKIDLLEIGETEDLYKIWDPYINSLTHILWKIYKQPRDQFPQDIDELKNMLRRTIMEGEFDITLSCIELILNDEFTNDNSAEEIQRVMETYNSAYFLITDRKPYQFYPRVSKEQGEVTEMSLETIRASGMTGAATHLRTAVERLNAREYAHAFDESIDAVESVARNITGTKKTLSDILKDLRENGFFKHRAFADAFIKWYAAASDEEGVRHSLIEDSSNIGVHEAMVMYGVSASFCAYLIERHNEREAQESSEE